ncbi:MAG: hypothetical protein MHM6MM_005524 [Cercozoa sp. M6MM]
MSIFFCALYREAETQFDCRFDTRDTSEVSKHLDMRRVADRAVARLASQVAIDVDSANTAQQRLRKVKCADSRVAVWARVRGDLVLVCLATSDLPRNTCEIFARGVFRDL